MAKLSCFKAYDIRGEIGKSINEDIAYRVGRAVAQHFEAQSIVVGLDARETSAAFAGAVSRGARDAGADVLNIGLAGTEEMYWAVTEFSAAAGIEVTASHNPINYNGMKIVKSGSQPLNHSNDFLVIKTLVERNIWKTVQVKGIEFDCSVKARSFYVDRVLTFVDISALKPLKIVINSGNGAAGPTFDAVAKRLSALKAPLEFVLVNHSPDPKFPNGIPNPLLPKYQSATASVVKDVQADFGVAFDGDFDRCFLFDEKGNFVPSEYVVGLLASIFLQKEKGAYIVHDPRVIWNTQNIIASAGGVAVVSKTGHAFMKEVMRATSAVYGGEMSAHHYFRDFAYCDSGMIPWLLVAELISRTGRSLGDSVRDRFALFPSSGEINFRVKNPAECIANVLTGYQSTNFLLDETDGVSLTFEDWRFNLRASNTEPLVRLNIETKGRADILDRHADNISKLIDGIKV